MPKTKVQPTQRLVIYTMIQNKKRYVIAAPIRSIDRRRMPEYGDDSATAIFLDNEGECLEMIDSFLNLLNREYHWEPVMVPLEKRARIGHFEKFQ